MGSRSSGDLLPFTASELVLVAGGRPHFCGKGGFPAAKDCSALVQGTFASHRALLGVGCWKETWLVPGFEALRYLTRGACGG